MKQMTQLGKMFTYIILMQLKKASSGKSKPAVDLSAFTPDAMKLVEKLDDMGVVAITRDCDAVTLDDPYPDPYDVKHIEARVTKAGGELVARYLAACAEELRAGHFGKYKWSKRSKFHQAILARLG